MSRAVSLLAALILAGVATFLGMGGLDDAPPPPVPAAPACPGPGPCPFPEPKPKPAPRPWGLDLPAAVAATVGGRTAPTGEPIMIDLPADQQMKNTGGSDGPRGPGSGSGLCVFTSAEMAGNWAHETVMIGWQQWMTRKPGGGTPRKFDKMITEYCREKNQPVPKYLNVEALDLDLIEKLVQSGHMVCTTYNHSPSGRYGGKRIAHMLNVLHADRKANGGRGWWAILDNNFPGSVEWLTTDEFRSTDPSWTVAFLRHGPPPPPRLPL